jgi:hypothetical protein
VTQYEYEQKIPLGHTERLSTRRDLRNYHVDSILKHMVGNLQRKDTEVAPLEVHNIPEELATHDIALIHNPTSYENCIYHTMHYAAKGCPLAIQDVAAEKTKVLQILVTSEHPVMHTLRNHAKSEGARLYGNDSYIHLVHEAYLQGQLQQYATVCAYAIVLNVNIKIYVDQYVLEHQILPGARTHTFIIHRTNEDRLYWHMSMVDDSSSEAPLVNPHCTVTLGTPGPLGNNGESFLFIRVQDEGLN